MTNEILQKISAVIGALNGIEVKGFQNLSALAGSISLLEEAARAIADEVAKKNRGDTSAGGEN